MYQYTSPHLKNLTPKCSNHSRKTLANMKAVLFRTGSGSIPVETPLVSGSHRFSAGRTSKELAGDKGGGASPRISMKAAGQSIRRCSSASDVVALETKGLGRLGSRSFPGRIPEEDILGPGFDGGSNKNRMPAGGCGGGGGGGDGYKIGAYYQEMLKSDPTNSLLLTNYAKYLHEVEGDVVKAEEYYGRAILASPGDGEVLSLYAKLMWESHRDEERAKSYFHQALHVSPNDCVVLGLYARFLWEAEEEDEEEENEGEPVSAPALVEAF